jgi:hypothetical protein
LSCPCLRGDALALPGRKRFTLISGLIGMVLLGGIVLPTTASAVDPTQWTTKVNPLWRDSFGNPAQVRVGISGPATSYAVCLHMTAYPAYNTKAATYDTYTYGKYAPCVKFSWTAGSSSSHYVGTNFTFGGPGTYGVHWYVPDVPAEGGVEVGTPRSFKWANSNGTWSPCPWDPQLQIGVWRPSRFQILSRCKTRSGTVTSSVTGPGALDQDRGWGLAYMHIEYLMRDLNFFPNPSKGSTWTIVGVLVCDRYHGHKEIHPVFKATSPTGVTYLSGPQYSTATPAVSGTWTLKSCG